MAEISLTAGMRANLLQLQSTERLLDRTQQRIATGKKVNSALDGPAAFFAAKGLTDRAADLTTLKESMGQAISTIKASDTAITSITSLVQQAKAVANTAKQNLGTDATAIASRAASASQFDELLSQIDTLVEDAGYAGKNLLLGDGAVYEATTQSVANVDTITGVSKTAVANIVGGTSAYNIDVDVTGAVKAQTTSATTAETDLNLVSESLKATSFTKAADITINVATTHATNDYIQVSNAYSQDLNIVAESSSATTATTSYLVSEGSALSAETTLGIKDLEVINWTGAEDVAISVSSTGGTTTFAVTTPTTTSTNLYTAAQTETDSAGYDWQQFVFGDVANTVASMGFLSTTTSDFSITSVAADTTTGQEVVSLDIVRTVDGTTQADYSMIVTYADGSTVTSSVQTLASNAGATTISLSVGSTIISFTGDDETLAFTTTVTINLTTVKFQGAGAGGGGSTAGAASIDVGNVAFSIKGGSGDATTANKLVGVTSKTLSLVDEREIKITQGTASTTRAVEPATGEGTLLDAKNTFVLSNGASISMTVDLDTLTLGSETIAAYTKTAAGTSNDLEVFFNEDSTSSVTIKSVGSDSKGLKIAGAANGWTDASDIDQAITQLDAALASLRTVGQTLTNNLSIVQTREDYTSTFVNNLEEGADKWTLADSNEEGANMLMLQTRQQLGTVSLSIASQSAQSILRLFG